MNVTFHSTVVLLKGITMNVQFFGIAILIASILIIGGFFQSGTYGNSAQPNHQTTNPSQGPVSRNSDNSGSSRGNIFVNNFSSELYPNNPASQLATSSPPSLSQVSPTNITNTSSKVAILVFDDNRKGNTTCAKPILDKYRFKTSFFVICNQTTDKGAMNWNDIAAMKQDGMDIE